jgi:pyruvate,water dikinase
MNHLVIPLTDAEATDASRFGPKAANQAALGQAGLPIPDGFCVDAEAYRMQIAALGLAEAAELAATLEPHEARQHVSAVRLGLYEQPIIDEILEPLIEARNALVAASDVPIVVRSSALMEDRAGSSFAGQFETFLDLADETEFLTAVRACWAALWASRARKYMDGYDLTPADTAMGLVIQRLVQARCSGGGLSQTADGGMLLSATWGLGTSIAQGEVVPDRYELTRDVLLREIAAGRKEHSVFCAHHGAAPIAHHHDHADEPCLDEAQVIELGHMLLTAEDVVGGAAEIEWAMDEAGFRMLQARPLHIEPAAVPDDVWLQHPGLRGHPAGIGWGTGRACVITCECELARVAPGDVLVTKVAGPALAQVLPRVAGVVAELGGSTSHLASLARERGIPMVLGVLDAAQHIPDGSQVAVDGVAGMVRWIR